MSLLSNFIQNQLIKAIEDEFVSHAPEVQAKIIDEVKAFSDQCLSWVNNKLAGANNATEEGK